ncbi:glycosyltransferase [uncultured Chryseobacterium sp.]|uniref:glycosyltransferase n=1 Tax=uncultured Chryseobacterium sp. TaxID=259322 RepID=UPI0025F030F7|nr:glycosyltransferase [uncultured Chryseobacterium sp.]
MQSGKKLKVSIYMITYNQEKHIEESIESVVNQKTSFNYKLFIGEDCSTDNTRKICIKLKEKYPDKIHLILNEHNLGATRNAKNIFNLCFESGADYIALIEGDDYWTDPLKLQKQIDFLENNPEYSISFHKVKEVSTSGEEQYTVLNSPETEQTLTIEDLAKGNCIHTPSVVFRKNMEILPEWLPYSPIGDYPLHMLNAEFGLIKYFPEEMAAYRIGDGMWSSQTRAFQLVNTLFALKLLITHFKQNKNVKKILSEQSNFLMDELTQIQKVQIDFDPEKAAYNLSLKKLFVILIRKLRYSLKR